MKIKFYSTPTLLPSGRVSTELPMPNRRIDWHERNKDVEGESEAAHDTTGERRLGFHNIGFGSGDFN